MRLHPGRPTRVAVDTNILLHLAEGLDPIWDVINVIKTRLSPLQIIVSPTTGQELAYFAAHAPDPHLRETGLKALQKMVVEWRFHLVDLVPVGHGIVEQIAVKLRREKLLPDQEINDSLILAESALLDCHVLLTGDAHLRAVDFQRLALLLQTMDVEAPLIATPREIVRKFHP